MPYPPWRSSHKAEPQLDGRNARASPSSVDVVVEVDARGESGGPTQVSVARPAITPLAHPTKLMELPPSSVKMPTDCRVLGVGMGIDFHGRWDRSTTDSNLARRPDGDAKTLCRTPDAKRTICLGTSSNRG